MANVFYPPCCLDCVVLMVCVKIDMQVCSVYPVPEVPEVFQRKNATEQIMQLGLAHGLMWLGN